MRSRIQLAAASALLSLAVAAPALAQSLVGTWQGSLTCKDQRSRVSGGASGALGISQPNGAGQNPLRVAFDGSYYFGMIFPHGGAVSFPPGTNSGVGFLTVCSSAPDGSYTQILLLDWKIDDAGKGSLKLSGTYSSPYGEGTCKGSFTRTSITDPMVPSSCP